MLSTGSEEEGREGEKGLEKRERGRVLKTKQIEKERQVRKNEHVQERDDEQDGETFFKWFPGLSTSIKAFFKYFTDPDRHGRKRDTNTDPT